MPGPLVLLALPLFAAVITYAFRRWAGLSTLVAVVTSGALAILCLRLPLDRSAFVLGQELAFGRPVVVLGRELLVTSLGQTWLAFVFVLSAVLFLCAWRTSQGRLFYPFSLAILALYVFVTLLQTFALAVLVFAVSATVAVFVIQGGLQAAGRGAQRYLVVTLLAVPLLLAAAWFTDQAALGSEQVDMSRRALLPTILGFGLLLAVFPFGTWMPAVAADAPPLFTAFLFTAGQGMALFLLLSFRRITPALWDDAVMVTMIQFGGLVMIVSGGVMAAAQHDLAHLFGYAALSDLGFLLLALVSGGSQGQALAFVHMVNRAVAITLLAAALAILRQRAGTDDLRHLHGVARALPVATMGLVLGILALAGFPLTAGFPTHWAISRAVWNWAQPVATIQQAASFGMDTVAAKQWLGVVAAVALVAAMVGILVGLFRSLGALLGEGPEKPVGRQPAIATLIVVALAALSVALGLFPLLLSQNALASLGQLLLF